MTNYSKTIIKSLLLTFIIMGTTSLSALAQTENSAKLITKIKKDQTYIFAEATDTTEEAAYKTAKAELDKYIEEYIITSGKAENAGYVIVKGIGLQANRLDLLRGTMHRVFLYVSQDDIIKTKGDFEVIEVGHGESATSQSTPKTDTSETSPTSAQTTASPITTTVEVIENTPATKKKDTTEEENVEAIIEGAPDMDGDTPASSKTTAATGLSQSALSDNYFGNLPDYRKTVVKQVMKSDSFDEVLQVLSESRNSQFVKNYGDYKSCKSTDSSYWVVLTPNGIAVLSPLRSNGKRVNSRTGAADSLDNYDKGIWFKM